MYAHKVWTEELSHKFKTIWLDQTSRFVYRKYRRHLMLAESIEYFMEEIERIMLNSYLPSDEAFTQ